MADILCQITTYKRAEIASAKTAKPLNALESEARAAPAPKGFAAALRSTLAMKPYALIAEIKKASPSKGLIRASFDPKELAHAYRRGGATCLSVLTDTPSFQGSLQHLKDARASVPLPILRKDFMLDPYQVVESRAWGADCILVIMACTSDDQAATLVTTAKDWGMDVLVEVHGEAELERALKLDTELIGINNRDLKTFHTTLETTERLAPQIPRGHIVVSESGIFATVDMQRLAKSGVRTFLVGESLMRQDDVAQATRALLEGQPSLTQAAQ